jgi:predicted helicase
VRYVPDQEAPLEGTWTLRLRFQATGDVEEDCSQISQALPWFWRHFRQDGDFFSLERLSRDGLAVLACASPEEAFEHAGEVRGSRVSAQVFDPERHEIPLEAGPEVPKVRGVFATPRPLVRWMVRSVDALLRNTLGRPEGLADPSVRLLDPAAGPMNFILEAYRRAVAKHRLKHGREGLEALVREHLVPHFHGIEILPGSWAAGQAAVRGYLDRLGVDARQEQIPLFLADALAGLYEAREAGFLAEEAAKAAQLKTGEPLTVVLGNPPFNGRSTSTSPWITELLRGYTLPEGRTDRGYFSQGGRPLGERNLKWLHDDYAKFLRLAQWMIDRAGEGIVAFVVNHNALEAPTFRGLRHSLLNTFERIYALDLHGNQRKRESGPSGERDENAFKGVAQGTGVLILVKRPGLPRQVFRGDLYGSRAQKLATLSRTTIQTFPWSEAPRRPPLFLFRGTAVERVGEYRRGVGLPEIFPLHSLGVITGRDAEVLALDRETLEARGLTGTRRRNVTSFLARPFDLRQLLFEERALARPRSAVMEHLRRGGNLGLLALRQALKDPGAFVTRWVSGHKVVSPYSPNAVFPLYLLRAGRAVPNVEPHLSDCLADRLGKAVAPEDLLGWVYATLNDSRYLRRFGELMRSDFPRIPLPEDCQRFRTLAGLGRELVSAHLLEHPRLAQAAGCDLSGDIRLPLSTYRQVLASYDEVEGRVLLNEQGLAFEGIEPDVWRHRIGSYRVLESWLRARAGRVLRASEARDFRRIAAALRVSLDLQIQIENV